MQELDIITKTQVVVWARPPADRDQECDMTLLKLRNILRGIEGVRFDVLKVGGLKDLSSRNPADLKLEPGVVTVLNFWHSWSPDSYSYMNNSNTLAQVHAQDWVTEGKVKFVCFSTESDPETLQAKVEAQGYTGMQHFMVHPKSGALKQLGIKMTPHLCIFDKEGKLVYSGHPS